MSDNPFGITRDEILNLAAQKINSMQRELEDLKQRVG